MPDSTCFTMVRSKCQFFMADNGSVAGEEKNNFETYYY
jgi:hypothetical protein